MLWGILKLLVVSSSCSPQHLCFSIMLPFLLFSKGWGEEERRNKVFAALHFHQHIKSSQVSKRQQALFSSQHFDKWQILKSPSQLQIKNCSSYCCFIPVLTTTQARQYVQSQHRHLYSQLCTKIGTVTGSARSGFFSVPRSSHSSCWWQNYC